MLRAPHEGNVSDIAIRLDGLLLGMVIAAGGLLFLGIAIAAVLGTLLAPPSFARSWKIATLSMGLCLVHAAGLGILAIYLDSYGVPVAGPDWIDWLAIPWLGLVVSGIVLLVRTRRRIAAPAEAAGPR